MRHEVELHHPAAQTHIPAHEEAASERRAAVVGLPPIPEPLPPSAPNPPYGYRKTWSVNPPFAKPRP